VAYVLVMTPEVRIWLHDLRRRDRASAIQVGQAIGMLIEAGPELGRPLADRVGHSRLSNLKSCGRARPGAARSGSCISSIPGGTRSCWWPGIRPGSGRPGTGRRSRWQSSGMRTT